MNNSRFDVSTDEIGELFVERTSGLRFRRVPEGKFQIGLSKSDLKKIRSFEFEFDEEVLSPMMPCKRLHVPSFLMTESPVLFGQAKKLIDFEPSEINELDGGYRDFTIAQFTLSQAYQFESIGYRLPTWIQLEASWRGMPTNTSLFPFGDSLPKRSDLAAWMKLHLKPKTKLGRNNIGLTGLFWGAWTRSSFEDFRCELDSTSTEPRSVKLDAAGYWPWQLNELILCVNGLRNSSIEMQEIQLNPVRLVAPVP